MSPWQRRLTADHSDLIALSERLPLTFEAFGEPPDRYRIRVQVAGLQRSSDGDVVLRRDHRFSIFLPLDYPRRPPFITWNTPIFHPNILSPDRHGAVCIGSWSASEGLGDLCERLVALTTYRSFSVADALDKEAAAWVSEHDVSPGDELDAFVAST